MRPDFGWRLNTPDTAWRRRRQTFIRYAFGHVRAKAISIGHFDGKAPSRRIIEKLGFQKLGVAQQAAIRCLEGTKLDRHEYILSSPDLLPELDVSWG
jgi:RimJ/RimL family protein N-acetyltransferase